MDKCNQLKTEMGLRGSGDWPDQINDPMMCCEMLYGLAEQIEQYKQNIEQQVSNQKAKSFNIESSEYQNFMTEIEELRDEKDAIRLDRDNLINEVKHLTRRQSVVKDSIIHEEARLKSLKSSTHQFTRDDLKSPNNPNRSGYNINSTPGTKGNAAHIKKGSLGMTAPRASAQNSRENSISKPRRASTIRTVIENDILTENNIDQIYNQNILIEHGQDNTFGNFGQTNPNTQTGDHDYEDENYHLVFGMGKNALDLKNDYEKQ
jgi:hypothetical protein